MSILKIRNSETGAWESVRFVEGEQVLGDGVPGYDRQEAARLAEVVQSHQNANTVSFLACSDLHYSIVHDSKRQTQALTHMGQAMALLRKAVHIDFGAMLGDLIWDAGEDRAGALEEMRFVNQCLGEGFAGIPNLRCRGNHDGGDDCGANLSEGLVFANVAKFNTGAVFGDRQAGYCYLDFPELMLRVICLNSSDGGSCQLSQEQVQWLEEVLQVEDQWRTLLLSHHPLDWGKSGGVSPIDIIKNANGIICAVHGHIHNYKVDKIQDTEVTRIAIPNGCSGLENGYGEAYGIRWGEDQKYPKTPDSEQDTAFCVITVDLKEKIIYADHYGAGYDRVVAYDDVQLRSCTVSKELSGVSVTNNADSVTEGMAYYNTLVPLDGYSLQSVKVTMGGVDITGSAVRGLQISVSNVTGALTITATAVQGVQVGYTNLVATLESGDSTAVFNGTGYLNGSYASGTGTGTDERCVVTGLLPYDYEGGLRKPIYIKGCTLDTSDNHVRILGFNSEKSCYFQVAFGQMLPAYFKVEVLGTDYYRLTPLETIDSAGAEVKYFRFSLLGCGENLIITLDEPIVDL